MKRVWASAILTVLLTGMVTTGAHTGERPEGDPFAPAAAAPGDPFAAPAEDPARSNAVNLGPINSPASDFGPIISPDGNALYFTSDRPGGVGGQDVWVSHRQNGEWQKPVNIGAPINTPGDEGPDSFSLSENALYFTACDREFGLGGCDIYVSFNFEGKWSVPENLGAPVNTKHNESNASISSDGDFIIFTSDRPGGQGGNDLWLARRGEMIKKLRPGFSTAGRWEEPINLGTAVNTADWEGVGFLMPDNETLYFSSRGRGARGADIFQAVGRDGTFNPAKNMGDIINTSGDDIYFTLPGSGDLAYFSSDMPGGKGREDLYSISIPLLIASNRLVVLKGTVSDAAGPVQAVIRITDPSTGRLIVEGKSNPNSGIFSLVFQAERIRLEVENESHQSYLETVDIGPGQAMATVDRQIKLESK